MNVAAAERAPEAGQQKMPVFHWHRDPPREWQEKLNALFPASDRVSWLVIGWVSGTPDEPIQRWALYEATPAAFIPEMKLELLGYLKQEAPDDLTPEHLRIIRYHEETGALLEPFWVIQGEKGGHKYRYNESEQKLLRLQSLPDEPPDAGALCYAPFDDRVVRQIVKWDHLRKGYASLKEAQGTEQLQRRKDFRAQLITWLNEQCSLMGAINLLDLETGVQRMDESEQPAVAHADEELMRVQEHYIETGRVIS